MIMEAIKMAEHILNDILPYSRCINDENSEGLRKARYFAMYMCDLVIKELDDSEHGRFKKEFWGDVKFELINYKIRNGVR